MSKKDKQKKALKQREHELEQKLAAAKAAKKAAKKEADAVRADALAAGKKALKKGKKVWVDAPLDKPEKAKKKAKKQLDAPNSITPADESRAARRAAAEEPSPEQIIAAAERVLAEGGSDGAMKSAKKAKAKAEARIAEENDDTDEIKARVQAKREKRAAGLELWDAVDRDDATAVAEWNADFALLTGRTMTSTDEVAERVAGLSGDAKKLIEDMAEPPLLPVGYPETEVSEEGGTLVARKKKSKKNAEGDKIIADAPAVEAQVAEEVVTETGREFAVGASTESDESFAKPSDAPLELESGRNGYKIWVVGDDGKVLRKKDGTPSTQRQFTRVTTYIDNLEDKTALVEWKMRSLLEGVVLNEESIGRNLARGDADDALIISKVRDAMHVRDVAIKKARRADRKGKLEVGELGQITHETLKVFKATLRDLAEQALEIGGANAKREKGTDLHELCEIYDREGMEAINEKLRAEEITPADHADVVAYAEAMINAGLEVVAIEQVVVNDARKHAGRLDRVVLGKTPGPRKTRRRMVADVKTGNIEYGIGKLAQQLEAYASSKAYDLETGERTDLKLDKTVALVIHLPAGTATCHIYPVDITIGKQGNALSAQVRAWRNESKKALNTSVDLAAPATEEAAS